MYSSLKLKNDTLKSIEFPEVLEQIARSCFSEYGKRKIRRSQPLENPRLCLEKGDEFHRLLLIEGEPPVGGIYDIELELKKVMDGHTLDGEKLLKIARTLTSVSKLKEYINNIKDKYPLTWEISINLSNEGNLIKEIDRCIDSDGSVKDRASDLLRNTRRELRHLNHNMKSRLDAVLSKYSGSLTNNLLLTRDGRYVIPLSSNKKGQYEGIIHGASGSGATVYFEPSELIQLNDKMRILLSVEEEEVRKILRELTRKFFLAADRIKETLIALEEIDFLYATASYAKKYNGSFLIPVRGRKVKLNHLKHPLIDQEKVIPIDFWMDEDTRAVIITGPNTGGKTVALKTVGLAISMIMSGLPVLAEPSSVIPEYLAVYADIGDEQSIEQSLSTFSAHMTRIIDILESADENSLVLLDELGAGTDPAEGSSLSMAIIDRLVEKGATTIATTHLTPLKLHALEKPHIENSSVEFNVKTLKPTYRLLMGIPGSSNAIEVSKRLGMPEKLIENARQYMGTDIRKLEDIIEELHREKSIVEQMKRQLETDKLMLKNLSDEYKQKLDLLKQKRYKEASQEIKELEDKLETILKEVEKTINISRSNKEQDKVKAVKKLQELRKSVNHINFNKNKTENHSLNPGDRVEIIETGVNGIVAEVTGTRILVEVGKMNLSLPANKVRPIGVLKNESTSSGSINNLSADISSSEIDIRGMTADDVPILIDRFLESMKVSGSTTGFIIHGKGTGKLGEAVWKYLRKNRYISSFRVGVPKEGGHGVTVIEVS